MATDKKELFHRLVSVLPIVAQLIPGDEGPAELIEQIVSTAEQQLTFRMQQSGQTREAVLRDAAATWDDDLKKAARLALLGHESDQE